jgi:hypothetical protein
VRLARFVPITLLSAAALSGCAHGPRSIPGTRINDDKVNREIVQTIEAYRVAVEKADAEALYLMVSDRYVEDSGTPIGSDDYGHDGFKNVLIGRFLGAKEIRYAMKYLSVRRTCPAEEGTPEPGCRAHVEVLVDASFTVLDARGKDRRTDKRDQNELVLEYTNNKWKFISGM